MAISIENLVRSGVVLAVGVPLVLGINGSLSANSKLAAQLAAETDVKEDAISKLKGDLAVPCLKYMMAKDKSKLERKAKDEIDEVLGGEAMHDETCKYVLR